MQSQDELSEEDSYMSIQKLNDDCLMCIFKFLPAADRIKIERVCKRWQEVAKKSWNQFKDLNLDPSILGLKSFGSRHQYSKIDDHVVEEILKRCGRYLKKVNVRFNHIKFDRICLVAKYCKNIQSITCKGISVEELRKLSNNCNNIAELRLFFLSGKVEDIEESLAELFSKNRKLRVLQIRSIKGSGKFLMKLPLDEVEEIKATSYEDSCNENVVNLIQKSKKLKNFEYGYKTSKNIIEALEISCTNLTKLKLTCNTEIYNADAALSQVFLKNKKLVSIKLKGFQTLTAECFLDLDNITVEKISFGCTPNIKKDFLMNSLVNFMKLHTLEVYNFNGIAFDCIDKCINSCSSLKTLTIWNVTVNENALLLNSLSKNIETLTVFCMVNSEDELVVERFLRYISCNLLEVKYLHLGFYGGLTNNVINIVWKLPKLEVLVIPIMFGITSVDICPDLETLSSLKILKLQSTGLKDYGLIRLLRCAPNLESLDITGCNGITNTTIDAAVEISKNRTNNRVLEIKFDHRTNINIDEIKTNLPTLLRLIQVN